MFSESEIVNLVLSVAFIPILVATMRDFHVPGKRYFSVGLLAMVGTYVFTVVEGFVAPDVFNMLEHLMLAVAGVAFAIGAYHLFEAHGDVGS